MVLGFVFFGFLLGGGLFAAHWVVTDLPLALDSTGWPAVEGTVASSRLVRKRKKRKAHRIAYRYEVNGAIYENDDVAILGNVFPEPAAGRMSRYPQGKAVVVRHHPADPGKSVLEPGVRWLGFAVVVLVALLFVPAGLWGLRASFRPDPD